MSDIMELFRQIAKEPQQTTGAPEYLICGLGNPGAEYARTRHNAGFMAIDYLSQKTGISCMRSRFRALCGSGTLAGKTVLLMKPQTYMNLSGEAVGAAARFYKIPPEHILVVSDDIDLPVGKLRLRAFGSAGGHNGLKNIIQHLGSDRFPRIKVGVGSPKQAGYEVVDWVIGMPVGEEQKTLLDALDRAAQAIPAVITQGMDKAMNRFN